MGVPPRPPILPSPASGATLAPLSPPSPCTSAASSPRCSDPAVLGLASAEPLLLAHKQLPGPYRFVSSGFLPVCCPQDAAFPSIQGLSKPVVVGISSWTPPAVFAGPQAISSSQVFAGSGGFPPAVGSSVPPLGTGVSLISSVRPVEPESERNPVMSASERLPTSAGLSSVLPGVSHKVRSFAQVVGSSWKPGFVRSHAASVVGFGKLPDIPVQPSISTKDGCPAVCFSPSEVANAVAVFDRAVIVRFLSGRLSLEDCHKIISETWGLSGKFSMGLLDSKSLLLRFELDLDVATALSRDSKHLKSCPFKIYRWHSRYNLREDAALAPVWISLPKLPIFCFVPSCLRSIASCIGKFLRSDQTTATLTRPSVARVCIEVDLSKPLPSRVWIGMLDGFWQEIIYEKLPQFCVQCNIQGHSISSCRFARQRPNQEVVHDVVESVGTRNVSIPLDHCAVPGSHSRVEVVGELRQPLGVNERVVSASGPAASVQPVAPLVSPGGSSGPDEVITTPCVDRADGPLVVEPVLHAENHSIPALGPSVGVAPAEVGGSTKGGDLRKLAEHVQVVFGDSGKLDSISLDREVGRQAILTLAASREGVSFVKPGFLSGSPKGKNKGKEHDRRQVGSVKRSKKVSTRRKESKFLHSSKEEEAIMIVDPSKWDTSWDIRPSGVHSASEEEESHMEGGYITEGGRGGVGKRRNKRHPDAPLRVRLRNRASSAVQRE